MAQAPFPVIHSILSGQALLERILSNYPIATPLSCRLYKRGLNDTYVVTTEREPYVLRVYRRGWRTRSEIDFELELLTFLHERNMPVAYPIARKQGGFIEFVEAPEGKRYIALFIYAAGQPVGNNLTARQSQRLGEVLAIVHNQMDDFRSHFSRPALDSDYLLDTPLTTVKRLYSHRAAGIAYLEEQVENLKQQLIELQLGTKAPTYGVCMGDLHAGNAHFSELDEPTLFDFDQCGYGWRTFDIGKFLHTAHRSNLSKQVQTQFLKGYENIRQLSRVEHISIPLFTKVAHIWLMGIRTSVVEEVVAYDGFTDEWFDKSITLLDQLSNIAWEI